MEADFIIIGGGIAGISAAARLASRLDGRQIGGNGRVLLLEAEDSLAYHASGRSAALYEPNYGSAPVVALSKASGDWFRTSGTLAPRGLMMVARAEQRAAFEHDLVAMEFQRISLDDAFARVPILNPGTVAHAAISEAALDIDTDRLIQGFARDARALGVRIETRAAVNSITAQPAGWQVKWPGGEATSPVLINAAGAWADQIAEMAGVRPLGIRPLRRSMARIPAPNGMDVSRWPMLFGPGEDWYMKPDAGALIVSPAEEDPVDAPHDAWADDMVLAEGLARYEAFVTAPVTRLIASWAGLRSFAPDRVPVIGFDPAAPGFFWLAGQGGYGFQTCPAASALAADLLTGATPDLPTPLLAALSPLRFIGETPPRR